MALKRRADVSPGEARTLVENVVEQEHSMAYRMMWLQDTPATR
jgi:hypothetical protein